VTAKAGGFLSGIFAISGGVKNDHQSRDIQIRKNHLQFGEESC
jgi:hypothetical protein